MSEGKPIYDPGALLLDYFDDFEHRDMAPGVVPVARVESTSRSFYRLYVPFFLQENRRKKLGAVEGGSIRLPSEIPWDFPGDFSASSFVSRFAYLSRLWCVDEVGQPIPNKFETRVSALTGQPHERAINYGFEICGFILREMTRERPVRWAWAANGADVLSQLKSWAEEAEAATRFDSSFPNVLAERNLRSWETRLLPDAAMHLRPDDVFCIGHSDKFLFHRFTRLSKSGLVITTRGTLREAGPICSLPSAFPPRVLDLLHSIHHWSFLPDVELWSAGTDPMKTEANFEAVHVCDLPNKATTYAAIGAQLAGPTSLYYTCDRIHWRRRLSVVLKQIFELPTVAGSPTSPRLQ